MNVQVVTLTATELNTMLIEAAQKGAELALSATTKVWLTQKEACEYLNVSRQTIKLREIERGLPAYRDGQAVRYLKSDLDLLLQGHRW